MLSPARLQSSRYVSATGLPRPGSLDDAARLIRICANTGNRGTSAVINYRRCLPAVAFPRRTPLQLPLPSDDLPSAPPQRAPPQPTAATTWPLRSDVRSRLSRGAADLSQSQPAELAISPKGV